MRPRPRPPRIPSLASSSSPRLRPSPSPSHIRTVQTFRPPPESKTTYTPPPHIATSTSGSTTITPAAAQSFDAALYLSLQPPAPSQLAAFAYRVGLLPPRASRQLETHVIPLVQQVCTHPSYVPFFRTHRPAEPEPRSNAALDVLGNSLLGLFAAEFVHANWPHLPTRATKAAVSAFVGPNTLCMVARELGAAPLLRWQRTARTESQSALIHADALMTVPRSLVGLIYQLNSITEARAFADAFFLSRQVDLRGLLKFHDPKMSLVDMLLKFGWEKPVARLLSESGRFTPNPIFVVGIYSSTVKLGESFGSSLRMAEFRACEDALLRLYLTRAPRGSFSLPSETFDWAGKAALFESAEAVDPLLRAKAQELGQDPGMGGAGAGKEWEGEGEEGLEHAAPPQTQTPVPGYIPPQLGESEVLRDYQERGNAVGGRNSAAFERRLAQESEDVGEEEGEEDE